MSENFETTSFVDEEEHTENTQNNHHEDGEEPKVVVNPYNFNNQFISERDIGILFNKFGIHYLPMNIELYKRAFIHKSYTKKKIQEMMEQGETVILERPEGAISLQDKDYERLEFLGDSILSPIVAKYLFERFPDKDEGFMTKMRTKLVCGEMLGYLAKELNFGKWMILSRHMEDICMGRQATHLLEDCFEAFIGAMYMDFNEPSGEHKNQLSKFKSTYKEFDTGIGFQICEMFFINIIEEIVDFNELIQKNTNYKDKLQRIFNEKYSIYPEYIFIKVEEEPNQKIFTMGLLNPEWDGCVNEDDSYPTEAFVCTGTGISKKKAEQSAAKSAIEIYTGGEH